MIIKKKKNINQNTSETDIPNVASEQLSETETEKDKEDTGIFEIMSDVTERQERRRGDRRRGYRRIEDRSLVSRAHEEAKLIKEQASKEGFNDGLKQAEGEIANLRAAITSLVGVKEEAYKHYQNDIIEIALEVARKILCEQVKLEPETILEIASNVIKETGKEESRITFVINPADELVLQENLETYPQFKNRKASMTIQTDDSIDAGSCRVITSSGQIDATFSSQLSIIKKAFQEGI